MAEPRVRILAGTGIVEFDTRFSQKAFMPLTGNVNLSLDGMDNGDEVTIWVKQDATGSRTLTIVPPAGVTNVVVGPEDAIASAANMASVVQIALIQSTYYILITAQGVI